MYISQADPIIGEFPAKECHKNYITRIMVTVDIV